MTRRLAILLSLLVVLAAIAGIVLPPYFREYGPRFRARQDFGIPVAAADQWVSAMPVKGSAAPRPVGQSDYRPHPFDWPQWLGPDRSGISRENDLLQDWPEDGPKLVWQADFVGEGYSTPTVAGGRVFTMGNRSGKEYVLALSEADGGEIWNATVGPVRANGGGYGGPRCSPTVDGDRLFALGINGDLVCLDPATGRERWRKDLRKEFGGNVGGWGYCESPLVDGDRVICTPGGKDATLVALDKRKGSVIWKGPVPAADAAAYSSAMAVDVGGQREYIQFLSGGVVGLSGDGHFLWRYAEPSCGMANCSTPIFRDDSVFAASNYGIGGGRARLLATEGGVRAEQVYFTKHMKNHHGGMVLVDGHIYGADGDRLTCVDWENGKMAWSQAKTGKGSISCADGRLYYRDERGPMLLVEVNPRKYVEHGRFEPPGRSGNPAWPHPVIANGKLYLRDQHLLYCYDAKKPSVS
jgi:outer membrane protein assembly factor BamB